LLLTAFAAAIDHGLYAFHRHHHSRGLRQRQGKVAQATEQVQTRRHLSASPFSAWATIAVDPALT
jgi:hypothetical protein